MILSMNPFKMGFILLLSSWMEYIQISAFQAVSIMGNEVFRFNLDLYPDATEGDSYTDMSKVDGVVSLNVGCIQIVYLHKFLMSLLVKSLCIHYSTYKYLNRSDNYDCKSYRLRTVEYVLFLL